MVLCAGLAVLLAVPAAHAAAPRKGGKPAAAAPEKSDSPFKPWATVTKDAKKKEGFFTVYESADKIFFEVKKEQIEQDFLGVFSLAQGMGSYFILGGLPLNDRLLAFQRVGNQLLLLEKNQLFTAPKGSAYEKAKDLSLGHSVLAALKIESERDSGAAVLVDMTEVFVSDLTDISTFMTQTFGGPVRFDKSRSTMTQVKAFPKNLELEALLTYSPSNRNTADFHTVPDSRYIPIKVHYSICALPENPMAPRLADTRVGNFMTVMKDFSRDDQEDFFVRYVNRWRLEKKDPNAEVSEVVQPIVFYLDRTIPEQYRPWVKQGIENWQKAYEAAGFKNAIIAKDAPTEEEDPDWDAEDVRYSTIRWITSSIPSFGAIGPSRTDPRTGEIFDADILFEDSFIQTFRNNYRRFAGPTAIAEGVLPTMENLPSFLPMDRMCTAQHGMADGGSLLRMHMLMTGAMPPGSPVPDEFLGAGLLWVTMHEVGHSLGLYHNFRSSTAVPHDRLHDKSFTQSRGLTGSVMDYASPNIAVGGGAQGDYYGRTVGTYDLWAIRYAYAPSGSNDIAADYAFARRIADESNLPGHEYSNDLDTYPAGAMDPRTNIWDLGNDPLLFAKDRGQYISELWKSDKFEERILGPNGEYPILRRAMNVLLGQYGTALGMAVKYMGGQYVERNRRGQEGGVDPLRPVASAEQRAAMQFLAQRAFAAEAFDVSPQLLNRLGPDRWAHWGLPPQFSPLARVDYALNDIVEAIQGVVLEGITDPMLLARLREAENRVTNPYTLKEHFRSLTDAIWGEVDGSMGPGMQRLEAPNTRRALQRAYVDRLATLMVEPDPRAPDDARALARLQLERIDSRARQALALSGLGDNTRAHLLESRARIKRSAEAQRLTDVRRAGGGGPGGAAIAQP
jgi:hypothetical protein